MFGPTTPVVGWLVFMSTFTWTLFSKMLSSMVLTDIIWVRGPWTLHKGTTRV